MIKKTREFIIEQQASSAADVEILKETQTRLIATQAQQFLQAEFLLH